MDYSVGNFEQAVSQFYYTDAVLQAQAHQWLVAAQNSHNAWSFVWELLQKERSAEVQFFAATTLHMKIMKSWEEVPAKEYENLRKHLLDAILNYSAGPKIVLNRLCIALSAYVLQTMPSYWPNAISELLAMFQSTDLEAALTPERRVWILLEVLTVIPEEFESMTMMQRHKLTVRNELAKTTAQVLSLVQSVLSEAEACTTGGSSEVLCQAVRCATTWLHFGIALVECDQLVSQLVRIVLSSCASSTGSEAAELSILALDQMLTHPDCSKLPSVVMNFIQRIICLREVITRCQSSDENQELVATTYSLFVSVVEAHSLLILKCLTNEMRDVSLQLLQIVLSCMNIPGYYPTQEVCSQLTFGIWFLLQDELMNMDRTQSCVLLPFIVPVYQELVLILLRKSEYPREEEFSTEDKETFRWYRQDIADTLMYCCNVLHNSILEILLERLQVCLAAAKSAWQPLESCLHAFAAIAENIDEREYQHLPAFFAVLQTLPFDTLDIHVATTALDVVGSYASWLNYHPAMLSHVVPLLLMGLDNCDTAPSATMSLKDVSRECQLNLKPYSEIILHTSQQVLNEGKMKQSECVRLMYTVGRVLSVLPLQTILQYLDKLLLPCVNHIKTLLSHEPSVSVKSSLLVRLKMLSMLFGTLDVQTCDMEKEDEGGVESDVKKPGQAEEVEEQQKRSRTQPVFLIMEHMMDVLSAVIDKWVTDTSIVQAVFAVFKHGVTTLLEDCIPFVPAMVDIILSSYKKLPTTSALDLAKQLSILCGRTTPHTKHIHQLLMTLTEETLGLTGQNSVSNGDLSQYTDIVENYLQLVGAIVRKNPVLLLEIHRFNINEVFEFAMKALVLPELPTVRAAVVFFTAVISQSRDHNALFMCVQSSGENLVERLLRCIGGEVSRNNVEPLSEILLALNKKHCDNVSRWLPTQLARQDFPSNRPTAQAKVHFAKMVLRERVNRRKLQETVREFSLVCRGLVNTEYSAHASLPMPPSNQGL